jgi:chemotaxis protein histidine kinase CheA
MVVTEHAPQGDPVAPSGPLTVSPAAAGSKAAVPAEAEAPTVPLEEAVADGLLRELERFFAEHAESVPYFAPEAAEHLEVMTRSLLALEQRTEPAQDEVASLFRAVHTLKGAAYTVGCAPVGDVAHRIEDLLEGVRDGRLSLSPVVIEAVFGGVDALRLLLGSASVISPSVRSVVQRTLDTLDALRPAPAPLEAEPVHEAELGAELEKELMAADPEGIAHVAPALPRPRFVPPGDRALQPDDPALLHQGSGDRRRDFSQRHDAGEHRHPRRESGRDGTEPDL